MVDGRLPETVRVESDQELAAAQHSLERWGLGDPQALVEDYRSRQIPAPEPLHTTSDLSAPQQKRSAPPAKLPTFMVTPPDGRQPHALDLPPNSNPSRTHRRCR